MEKPAVGQSAGREVAGPPECLPHHSAFAAFDFHFDLCPSCQRFDRCARGQQLWDAWLEEEAAA